MRSGTILGFAVTVTAFSCWAGPALAADVCQFGVIGNSGQCYIPAVNSSHGGTYPSFADSFNINPASLPTIPTPFGVEGIASFGNGSPQANFALIKGLQQFGAGFSSNSDTTFFTDSLNQGFANTSYADQVRSLLSGSPEPNLNFGAALALPVGDIDRIARPTVGASLRYDRLSQKWDPEIGGEVASQYFHGGVSFIVGPASATLPTSHTLIVNIGVKLSFLHLEYTLQDLRVGSYEQTMNIVSSNLRLGDFLITGAFRNFDNVAGNQVNEWFFSIQYFASQRFSAGYLNNYIEGKQSLGLQFLL